MLLFYFLSVQTRVKVGVCAVIAWSGHPHTLVILFFIFFIHILKNIVFTFFIFYLSDLFDRKLQRNLSLDSVSIDFVDDLDVFLDMVAAPTSILYLLTLTMSCMDTLQLLHLKASQI